MNCLAWPDLDYASAKCQLQEKSHREEKVYSSSTPRDVALVPADLRRHAILQSAVSRLEAQRDGRLSTLRKYVAALGGHLEMRCFHGFRMGIGATTRYLG